MVAATNTHKRKINPHWYKWQADVARWLYYHRRGCEVATVVAPRQTGKTYWITTTAVWFAETAKGQEVMILEPTHKQLKKVMRALYKQYRSRIRSYNQSDFVVELRNGSIIRGVSAKQGENLRGYTNDLLLVDEGAYIADDIFEIILSTIQKRRGNMIIVSSPNFCYGFFYEQFINPNNAAFNWADGYDLTEVLPDAIKAKFKRIFSPQKYTTEVLGQFLSNNSPVFGTFADCVSDIVTGYGGVLGVDWGSGVGGDYTAVIGWNDAGGMHTCEYWNDLDETATIERIVGIAQRTGAKTIAVETNSIGKVFLGLLRKAVAGHGITIRTFNTDNRSKNRIIERMQVALQNGKVTILPDPELEKEMNNFECKPNHNGLRIYGGKPPVHDDLVMAMCIGYNAVGRQYATR